MIPGISANEIPAKGETMLTIGVGDGEGDTRTVGVEVGCSMVGEGMVREGIKLGVATATGCGEGWGEQPVRSVRQNIRIKPRRGFIEEVRMNARALKTGSSRHNLAGFHIKPFLTGFAHREGFARQHAV